MTKNYSLGWEQFVIDWLNGRIWPGSWREHVSSWIGGGHTASGIEGKTVRYEDLLSNPIREVEKLINYLNVSVSLKNIERAVAVSTLENMRKKELANIPAHDTAEGYSFIGPAQRGLWHKKLTPKLKELIMADIGDLMERFGYE